MATETALLTAFKKGAGLIKDQVQIGRLRDAIARGDVGAVLTEIDISESAWDELRVLLVQTYAEGGVSEIDGMAYRDRPRWNSATSQSERYARDVIGARITRIAEDSRDAVRMIVGDGLAFGRSVDRIAVDIIGRRDGNGRSGGVVGLNAQQAQWVLNMRGWLADDPAQALTYSRRDKRFDAVIRASIREGKPLTQAQIDRITAAYAARLLLTRGRTIARTERQSAINAGRQEAWRQAADRLGLPVQAVRKTWVHSTRKMEPRPFHLNAGWEKQTVQGLDTPFFIGGFTPLYPHDPNLPASEVVNCSCSVRYSINRGWRNG
ncbi:MAG: hypothetical protein ACRCYS_12105 [Beijerinckiaceae bacterium]